jgi:hypothetical protein
VAYTSSQRHLRLISAAGIEQLSQSVFGVRQLFSRQRPVVPLSIGHKSILSHSFLSNERLPAFTLQKLFEAGKQCVEYMLYAANLWGSNLSYSFLTTA